MGHKGNYLISIIKSVYNIIILSILKYNKMDIYTCVLYKVVLKG